MPTLALFDAYEPAGPALRPFPPPPPPRRARAAACTPCAAARALRARAAPALTRLFLPRGALPPDYVTFQALDALQGLCSYLRGVLTLHATLEGLGVGGGGGSGSGGGGSGTAALAATLTLLLKEGSSHAASLGFAFFAAPRLDAEVRAWRLFADVANDLGLTLELAAPLAGAAAFLPLTCAANAAKAVCGVAAGATRVAISAHFARAAGEGGGGGGGAAVAEVAAKEGTQETAVTFAGLALGFFLARALNASRAAQWAAFAALTLLHVAANWAAVRALALRTLSRSRAAALRAAAAAAPRGAPLPSPRAARAAEPALPVQWRCGGRGRERADGARVRLGVPLAALAAAAAPRGGDWRAAVTLVDARGAARPLADALGGGGGGGGGGGASPAARGRARSAARGGGARATSPPRDFFLVLQPRAGSRDAALVAFGERASAATMLRGWLAAASGAADAAAADGFERAARAAGWDVDVPALDEEGFRVALRAGKEE